MEFALSQAVASGDAVEHRPSEGGHCVQNFLADLDLRDLPGEAAGFELGADLMQIHAATTGAIGRIGERVDADPGSGTPNRSTAALTEGDVLGSLAQIRTLIGIGRSRALAATEDAAARFRQEELRREIEARRLDGRAALEAQWALERVDVAARANERIESMYGGYQLPSVFNRN